MREGWVALEEGDISRGCACGAEGVCTGDDVDWVREEGGFAEGDNEADSPRSQADILHAKASVGVLADAQEAKERQSACAPVAGSFEGGAIEAWVEGPKVDHGEGDLGDGLVLMAVVVAEACHELIEATAARERAELACESVVGQRCDEAGDSGDLVAAGREGGGDQAECIFGERVSRVDGQLTAQ